MLPALAEAASVLERAAAHRATPPSTPPLYSEPRRPTPVCTADTPSTITDETCSVLVTPHGHPQTTLRLTPIITVGDCDGEGRINWTSSEKGDLDGSGLGLGNVMSSGQRLRKAMQHKATEDSSDSAYLHPDRLAVDPAIKGLPQGWEDDPAIPLPKTPIRPDGLGFPFPNTSTAALPPLAPTTTSATKLDNTLSPPKHHSRLNSFRGLSETRTKLTTWKAKNFPEMTSGLSDVGKRKLAERRQMVEDLMGANAKAVPPTAIAPTSRRGRTRPSTAESDNTPSVSRAQNVRPFGASSGYPRGVPGRVLPKAGGGVERQGRVHTRSLELGHEDLQLDATEGLKDEEDDDTDIDIELDAAVKKGTASADDIHNASTIYTEELTTRSASSLPLTSGSGHPTSPRSPRYQASITSTKSSSSRRERVLGLRSDPMIPISTPGASKIFVKPNVNDVLPFAAARPFSSWDLPADATGGPPTVPIISGVPVLSENGKASSIEHHLKSHARRRSLSLKQVHRTTSSASRASLRLKQVALKDLPEENHEGWRDLPGSAGVVGRKKIWVDKNGDEACDVYKVGWEREVLDLEGRLHETMYEMAGESHKFAKFASGSEPASVLDVGTGTGAWPISQALVWHNTRFVGLDIVPAQVDLKALAAAEKVCRSTSSAEAEGEGVWQRIANRVTWDRANCLDGLPYDTGVFSYVHIRFLSLAIPEPKWGDLLEECVRVLSPGGTLEIVEMGISLPPSCPVSIKRSFASTLLSDMIHPNPSLPIKFALPTIEALVHSTVSKPVFEGSWAYAQPYGMRDTVVSPGPGPEPPGGLADATMVWVRSVQEYKGTGLVRRKDIDPSLGLGSGVAGTGSKVKSRGTRDNVVGDSVVDKVKAQLGWLARRNGRWQFNAGRKGHDIEEREDNGRLVHPRGGSGNVQEEAEDADVELDGGGDPGRRISSDGGPSSTGMFVEGDERVKVWAWVGKKKG